MCLAIVLDVLSLEVVAWAMVDRLRADLAHRLNMAIEQHHSTAVHHSDI